MLLQKCPALIKDAGKAKARILDGAGGTAKAVPFQKPSLAARLKAVLFENCLLPARVSVFKTVLVPATQPFGHLHETINF